MIKLERFQEIIVEQIKHFKPEDDLRVHINRHGVFEIIAKNRVSEGSMNSRIVFVKDKDER